MENDNRQSKVFFVQGNMRFSTDLAKKFGEVHFFMERGHSPFNTKQVIDELTHRLSADDFDPELDYVALTGPSIAVSLMMLVLGSLYPRIQVLIFDARYEEYRARTIEMPGSTVGAARPGLGAIP